MKNTVNNADVVATSLLLLLSEKTTLIYQTDYNSHYGQGYFQMTVILVLSAFNIATRTLTEVKKK